MMSKQAAKRSCQCIGRPAPPLWLRAMRVLRLVPRPVGLKVSPMPVWMAKLRDMRDTFVGLLWVVRLRMPLKDKLRVIRALQVAGRFLGRDGARTVGYRIAIIILRQGNGDRISRDHAIADLFTRVADMMRPPTSMSLGQIIQHLDRYEQMAQAMKGGSV